MSKNSLIPLSHLAVISVQGKDAAKFLQGQCTQDVSAVEKGEDRPGAFCTPKGRTVANVWLHANRAEANQIDMICAASVAPVLHKHLAKYIPFFRGTQMQIKEDIMVFGAIGSSVDLPESHQIISLSSSMTLVYGPDIETIDQNLDAWLKAEIENRILWLSAEQSEQWIPQNINLDSSQAVSFSKGCYTGQEVVARLHYKGDSKKRLFAISVNGSHQPSNLFQQGKNIGNIVQQAIFNDKTYALAVISKSATEAPFFIDENEQVAAELLN